jgi:osmotically-inducible protein OsmY
MAWDFDPDIEREIEAARSFPKEFGGLPGERRQRDDEAIKRDIESILFYDDLVRSYEVKIDVSQGVVTLSGTVSNDMERQRAMDDALKVPGVKEVRNDIQISRQAAG